MRDLNTKSHCARDLFCIINVLLQGINVKGTYINAVLHRVSQFLCTSLILDWKTAEKIRLTFVKWYYCDENSEIPIQATMFSPLCLISYAFEKKFLYKTLEKVVYMLSLFWLFVLLTLLFTSHLYTHEWNCLRLNQYSSAKYSKTHSWQ